MPSEHTLLNEARAILEGRYAFQYLTTSQREAFNKLVQHIESPKPGTGIFIGGQPGAGVTTCLQHLMTAYPKKIKALRCDIYTHTLTLIERVSDTFFPMIHFSNYKKTPEWVEQYFKAAGVSALVIDDLDRFVQTPHEFNTVVDCLKDLARDAQITVLTSTRNARLQTKCFNDKCFQEGNIWIDGQLLQEECIDMGKLFFETNNSRLGVFIRWEALHESALRLEVNEVATVMSLIETMYVEAILRNCCNYPPLDLRSTECRYELARLLYSAS